MKKILISLATITLLSTPAIATVQMQELIKIDDKEERMIAEPLSTYLDDPKNWAVFKQYIGVDNLGNCSALWRSYRGHWEIKNSKLFLTELELDACSRGSKKLFPLSKLFPNRPQPIFADWYSGTIKVQRGETTKIFEIKKGIVVRMMQVK
jgi:hypothetical protein